MTDSLLTHQEKSRQHDRWMLAATLGATIAAFIGVGVGAWFNRETVNVAQATLKETREAGAEQKQQFDKVQKNAAKDLELKEQQFAKERLDAAKDLEIKEQQTKDAKVQEVKRAEVHEAEIARQEKLARTPLLLQHQCCNPVAIVVETDQFGRRSIRLPHPDEFHYFGSEYNKDHVIRIANLGRGPAIRIRAAWHPERIISKNGTERLIEREAKFEFTKPLHLRPEEDGQIVELPRSCFYENVPYDEYRAADVRGYLELLCEDNSSDSVSVKYNFLMIFECNRLTIKQGVSTGILWIKVDKNEKDKPTVPQNASETRVSKIETKSPDLADEKTSN